MEEGENTKMKSILRKRRKKMIYIILVIVLILGLNFLLNPLRWPANQIRNRLLNQTPIGTSMEDVIKVVEGNKKWEIENIRYDFGYTSLEPPFDEIGEKSITVYLGEYWNPLVVDVTAWYGFDEEGKLIDVAVRKDVDTL